MISKTVKLGLIGAGTVGTGVLKMLRNNISLIEQRVGAKVQVAAICDKNLAHLKPLASKSLKITNDYRDIVLNPDIDIVVELIGGYEPARTIILAALRAGKHVVTANKAVLAKYWDEIFRTANEHMLLVYFEAAVGGGIPVIQALNEGLAGNRIEKIMGILNGTTNYILTKMSQEGLDYKTALVQAQKAGFAEADPTFDVQGIDAAHKLSILASIASSGWVKLNHIACEGIADLSIKDVRFLLDHLRYEIKLLGIAKNHNGVWEARVHPTLIPKTHPFANVRNEYNAIFIHGDAVGDVMFYGKGAGQMAAASAVVSDIVFLARHVANGTAGKVPYVNYKKNAPLRMLPMDKVETQYYLRFVTSDKPGVLSKIAGILSRRNVSIASVHQEENTDGKGVPILIITHTAAEGAVRKSIAEIDKQPFTKAKTVLIRIEK